MKITPHLVILKKVSRYVFGLLILFGIFLVAPYFIHLTPIDIVMILIRGLSTISITAYLLIVIALYFISTGRYRWKLDIILIIMACVSFFSYIDLVNPASNGDIRGDAILKVNIQTEALQPVQNIEVDVGKTQGKPPQGGWALTDTKGIATFQIKAGNYVVYFNTKGFPQNLQYPNEARPVKVEDIKNNQITITLLQAQ